MQILFVPAVAYSSREKDERNVRERERESERNEQNWKLSFSLSLFPLFYPLKARRRTEYVGQHVREAFLTRVTRRNRNPLLRRRFGLAHWLPVPVTRFGANWRPRLISKLQNIFTLLWFSTPPPPPLLLHSFARLSLSLFLRFSLCLSASWLPPHPTVVILSARFFPFFIFLSFFSSFFFLLVFSLVFFHCTRSVCILVIPAVLTLTSKPARRDKAEYPGSGERRFDGMERRGNRERRV